MDRRQLLANASLLLASACAAGCTGPTSRRRPTDTLVYGSPAASDAGYDPRVTLSRNEEQVILQIFDTLIAADVDDSLHAGLASTWTVAPDQRSVVLQLREDVRFHDDTPFDAAAVKFTFDSIVAPETASMGAIDLIGPYAGADVLASHTIRLRWHSPFPRILHVLTDRKTSIVSPTAVRALGNAGFSQAPVGTGPFRFVSWTKGDAVVMERNPNYRWSPAFMQPGPPAMAHVIHRFIPNDFTRVAALDAGEIDICALTPLLDTHNMARDPRYSAIIGVAQGLPSGFCLNTSRGVFTDLTVRRAFMMSIDRPWLSKNLFFDLAQPAWGPLASSFADYWPGVRDFYAFDPASAAHMLDEAGWRMGADGIRHRNNAPLAVYLPIFIEPVIGVAIQAQARRVGFDVTIEQVTRQKQDELMFNNGYDMLSQRWDRNDPGVLELAFLSRNVPAPGHYSFNWARWQDPVMDDTLTQAAASVDPAARKMLYADAQRRIMEAAVFLPVHEQVQAILHPRRLTGLRLASGNWHLRLAGAQAS